MADTSRELLALRCMYIVHLATANSSRELRSGRNGIGCKSRNVASMAVVIVAVIVQTLHP